MQRLLRRAALELGRAVLAVLLIAAIAWTGVVVASNVGGGSGTASIATLTPGTSAQFDAACSDNTGVAGSLVFSIAPTLIGTASKAALSLTPQANPSGCALGDVFAFTSGVPRLCSQTTPILDDVGAVLTTTSVTAHAGGGQASASTVCSTTPLTLISSVVTAADSVKFAVSPTIGRICELYNNTANAAALYPASGGHLCVQGATCLANDASTSIAANSGLRCWSQGSSVWNCR